MCASATSRILFGILWAADHFACLAPFEVVRVEERVQHDDDVHEWGRKEVQEVAHKVLNTLFVVPGEPEADTEGVELL